MKKCDCFNQHDKEIREVLIELKNAAERMRQEVPKIRAAYESSLRNFEEPNPLIGILMGACIIAAIISVAAIVIRLVR